MKILIIFSLKKVRKYFLFQLLNPFNVTKLTQHKRRLVADNDVFIMPNAFKRHEIKLMGSM